MISIHDIVIHLKDSSSVCVQSCAVGTLTDRSIVVNGAKVIFNCNIIDVEVLEAEEIT